MGLSGIRNGDLCIYQGDDFACVLTILNAADGTPADLTDFTAQSQIRTGPADQAPGMVAATMLCTVLVPNQVSLWLPREQTQSLSGQYLWDLQLSSSAGNVTTVLGGNCNVMPEVTRPEWQGNLWDAIVASQPLWRPVSLYRTGPTYPWVR
jgi:hypothetical protein